MTPDVPIFRLNQIVYQRVNGENRGQITGILFSTCGISYQVRWGDLDERFHSAEELCLSRAEVEAL